MSKVGMGYQGAIEEVAVAVGQFGSPRATPAEADAAAGAVLDGDLPADQSRHQAASAPSTVARASSPGRTHP